MSKGNKNGTAEERMAFVLGGPEEAEVAATALRASGFQAITPAELDAAQELPRELEGDEATLNQIAARDLVNSADADLIVVAPGGPQSPAHVSIVTRALHGGKIVDTIENLCPNWNEVEAS